MEGLQQLRRQSDLVPAGQMQPRGRTQLNDQTLRGHTPDAFTQLGAALHCYGVALRYAPTPQAKEWVSYCT